MQYPKSSRVGLTDNELSYELKLLSLFQPETIVEIGSTNGAHVNLISSILKKKKHIIVSIDPWDSLKIHEEYCRNVQLLKKFYRNINYISVRGKSQSPGVIAELEKRLSSVHTGIDYLFIDGAHDEKSVISDWKNYQEFVNKSGIICFHDVLAYEGVALAWKKVVQQLDSNYSTRVINAGGRFLLTGQENVHLGLGYIYKRSVDEDIRTLLESF
ncbi:hypothetical protein COU53_01830 [Candidatus Pacearchaeota archaeon CG10_big_fil_rev_8_21_14_0_10_30_48]|nr:MAG: hypothetical protein COU53_01830 [Candidatus Pacearchaeota archaeon CG10_big_fil_rev_8_21_14_0_10_30_48]